jgi:ABC-type dipeptide/oligopeptide/nickel transport system ATPase subunit
LGQFLPNLPSIINTQSGESPFLGWHDVANFQRRHGRNPKVTRLRPKYLEDASTSGKIMLAVTGASGVGKSSLVNSLRKVRDNDPDAAQTGIKETTMEPSMYSFRADQGILNQRFYRSFEEGMELRPKEQVVLHNVSEKVDGCQAEVISTKHEKVKVRLDGGSVLDVDLTQVP